VGLFFFCNINGTHLQSLPSKLNCEKISIKNLSGSHHVLFWDLFGMCRRQSLNYVDRVMHEPDKSLICLTDCEKTMHSNIYYSLQLRSCLPGYDVKCK